jgi:enoyl-CoA hydratase/carnithine racemase
VRAGYESRHEEGAARTHSRLLSSTCDEIVMKIEYAIADAIGTITLSNPPYNTLTHPVFTVPDELDAFLRTPALKGVIVRGAGRHFCGGADFSALAEQARDIRGLGRALDTGKMLLDALTYGPVPVVAAIRGSCLGAGLEIALACHFRVAAGSAMIGFPESEHGLMPGLGGTLTQSVVSRPSLMRLVLTAEMVRGEEALERGLVDRCITTSEVESRARLLLDSLVGRRSAEQVHAIMSSIANGVRMPRAEAIRRETELFCSLARSGAVYG